MKKLFIKLAFVLGIAAFAGLGMTDAQEAQASSPFGQPFFFTVEGQVIDTPNGCWYIQKCSGGREYFDRSNVPNWAAGSLVPGNYVRAEFTATGILSSCGGYYDLTSAFSITPCD